MPVWEFHKPWLFSLEPCLSLWLEFSPPAENSILNCSTTSFDLPHCSLIDTTPLGQVLNQFFYVINNIDEVFPKWISMFLVTSFAVICPHFQETLMGASNMHPEGLPPTGQVHEGERKECGLQPDCLLPQHLCQQVRHYKHVQRSPYYFSPLVSYRELVIT